MRVLALGSTATNPGSAMSLYIMLIGMVAVMYFFMVRPQRKEQQKMREMFETMEVGDAIMTTGGFYGILIDIGEEDVIVEFGNNKNCRIPMRREAISKVEKPGEAVAVEAAPKKNRKERKAEDKAKGAVDGAKEVAEDVKETAAEIKDEVGA